MESTAAAAAAASANQHFRPPAPPKLPPQQQPLPPQQQQHHHNHHHHVHRQQGQSSHVNGKGLWSNWERSFKQPLDALLDLVDNTVDAHRHINGTLGGGGRGGLDSCRIRIDRGVHAQNYKDDCIQIMNSAAPSPIKPMYKILEVFSSDKNQESIGENGVGVKQASACLSNFSVCVTKNENPQGRHGGGGTIEVGFLSKALQRDEGIVLPSYTLPLNRKRLEDALEMLINTDDVFAECIDIFGDKDPDAPPDAVAAAAAAAQDDIDSSDDEAEDPIGPPPNEFRQRGQDRLLDIIDTMTSGGWSKYHSVFCLVLARLRLKSEDSKDLLKTLQVEMPKTYIHLKPDQADIRIDGKEIQFQYWERRLVELTVFPIAISRSEIVKDTFDKSKKGVVGSHHYWALCPPAPYDTMNIYCGFDPVRARDKQSSLHLYIYTRECGRLVKCNDDARNELNLGAGSTEFCSGLTVILDDTASTLPLTPTKQDIAWTDAGDQGEIHRLNVYAWLRAVTNLYYKYWKDQVFSKSKEQLTSVVVEFAPRVAALTAGNNKQGDDDDDEAENQTVICPLQDTTQFTNLTGFNWTIRNSSNDQDKKNNITITSYKEIKVNRRKGSLMSFPAQPKQPAAAAIKKPSPKPTPKPAPRSAPRAAAKATAVTQRRHSNDVLMKEDPEECSTFEAATAVASSPSVDEGGSPPSPRKRRAKRPRANNDAEEPEEEAELFYEELREDEWKNEKRGLENQCRRLQSTKGMLQENEKQLTAKLEQSERERKKLARDNDECSRRVKELEDEKIKSQQQGGAAAGPGQQAADLLLAQVQQLQAEKKELNRQVEKLKGEKKQLAALHAHEVMALRNEKEQLQEDKRKLQAAAAAAAANNQTILASTIADNNRLLDENKRLREQNVVTQDEEQLDEDDDDDSDDI